MRQCLFCGGSANSKEHVWPAWLLALLSADERSHVFHLSHVKPPRDWGGAPAELTIRGVCKTCNNGWMSELETMAQELVEPLILGESATLDIEQQLLIAAWAIKGSMLWEPASGIQDGFYTADDRRTLYDECLPPHRTSVWIAKYDGLIDRGLLAYSTNRSYRLRQLQQDINARLTTMVFGHLVVQTMTFHVDHPGRLTLSSKMAPGPWTDPGVADIRIFPFSSDGTQWPPPVALTDAAPTAVQDYGQRW